MSKKIEHHCKDCNKPISRKAKLCRKCFFLSSYGRKAWNKGKIGLKPNWSNEKRKKMSLLMTGKNNPGWKGGKVETLQGYTLIRRTNHPFNVGGYVLEHRLVMEEKLGRYLDKKELVHHRNGIKSDNRINNLIIVTRDTHSGLVICPFCREEFEIK